MRVNTTPAKVGSLVKDEFPIQQLKLFCPNFSTTSSDQQAAGARAPCIKRGSLSLIAARMFNDVDSTCVPAGMVDTLSSS